MLPRKLTHLTLFSLLTFFAGCGAPKVAFDNDRFVSVAASQPVALAYYDDGPPDILTPGTFGQGGGILDMIVSDAIDDATSPGSDPGQDVVASYMIAQALKSELDALTSLKASPVPPKASTRPEQKGELPAVAANTFLVEMNLNWFVYRSTAWNTYDYSIGSTVTLLTPEQEVLWRDRCLYDTKDAAEDRGLHRDQFAVNNGEQVKSLMQFAAEQCVLQFKDILQTMGPPRQ